MRILVATYGSRGDVEPIVALARALKAAGAEVGCCAPPDGEFLGLCERAGVDLTPFAKSWKSWGTDETTADEKVPDPDAYVRSYIDATWRVIIEAADNCDVIVASGMLHFIAQSVAEILAIPHRFALFCPSLLPPQGWQPFARAPIDAHRASLGLPPVEDIHAYLFTRHPWLAADPALSPPADSAGFAVERTGAWILRDERPLPADLLAFLEHGPPPVYVGFGSMRMAQDSAVAAIEASRALGRRAIVASGWAGLRAIDRGDDCFVTGDVNQQALFRRVAAVIHHGGAGTTTTAARAGAPQIVIPQAVDQPYWARCVERQEIGIAHDGPVPTTASLTALLGKALRPQIAAKAAELAKRTVPDGAADAARRLIASV